MGSDGVYVYTEVANGAAAPVLAAGRLRLFRAVASATAITGVADLRKLSAEPRFGTDRFVQLERATGQSVGTGVWAPVNWTSEVRAPRNWARQLD